MTIMRSNGWRVAASAAAVVMAAGVLAGCSSDDASAPTEAIDAAESAAAAAGTAEMVALCDQMIAEGLTTEAATALAEENGYVARVGTIDGQPQAVTMDYREDRFTFETQGDVVIACTYG